MKKDSERHVCPWWMGYFLINPFRKFVDNPKKILGPVLKPGMRVLDVGCGMGFYSLPAAKIVGEEGKVICVDLQKRMLKTLEKRVKRTGLEHIMILKSCPENSLGLDDLKSQIDVVLAMAVVHEVPNANTFFSELYDLLSPGGVVIFNEPKGHVSLEDYEKSLFHAKNAGFDFATTQDSLNKRKSVLVKKESYSS